MFFVGFFFGEGQRVEECLKFMALALFGAHLGHIFTEGYWVFEGTHTPLTSEPDWSVRQPVFSVEDPAQNGPTHQRSGHFSQCW